MQMWWKRERGAETRVRREMRTHLTRGAMTALSSSRPRAVLISSMLTHSVYKPSLPAVL
jgi:hypothetical protein